MSDDKKIRLGIDSSEAIQNIDEFNRRAQEMVSNLIGESREQLNISSQIIQSLKEEIALLEERNRLQRDSGLSNLDEGSDSSNLTIKIEREFKEEQLTLDQAKQIIEAIQRNPDSINGDNYEIDALKELILSERKTSKESQQRKKEEPESNLDEFKERAEELISELTAESRERKDLSSDIISDIKEQISLLEKRNNLQKEERLFELSYKEKSGKISERDADKEKEDISFEYKEERLTLSYAKDIVEAIERTAREQIDSNKETIEKLITEEGFGKAAGGKSEIDALRELIIKDKTQQQESGKEDEKKIRQHGGAAGLFAQSSSAVIGSQSAIDASLRLGQVGSGQMMQTGAGMGGLAGGAMMGAAAVIGATLFAAAKGVMISGAAEPSFMRMAGIGGGSYSGYREFGESAENYGYTKDIVAQRRADMSLAGLTTQGSGQAALESLQMERGLGLSAGLTQQLERFQRPGMSNVSSMETTQQMIAYLRATGVVKGGDMSALPEYLQSLVSLSQQQLTTLGSVDTGINTKMIASISNLDNTFKNPDVLGKIVSSFNQGLTTAPSEQIEALQYTVLNEIAPNKNIFELKKMREDPFGTSLSSEIDQARKDGNVDRVKQLETERTQRQDYLPSLLESLKEISPNRNIFEANILEMFPQLGTLTMASKVAEGFEKGSLQDILDRDISKDPKTDISGRALEATGIYTREVAKFTNSFMTAGDKVVEALSSLKTGIVDLTTKVRELTTATLENTKATNDVFESISDSTFWGKVMKYNMGAIQRKFE